VKFRLAVVKRNEAWSDKENPQRRFPSKGNISIGKNQGKLRGTGVSSSFTPMYLRQEALGNREVGGGGGGRPVAKR